MLASRPWLAMFLLTVLVFAMNVLRGSSMNYFFGYYLDPQAIRAFLEPFALGAAEGPAAGWHAVLSALGLLVRADGSNAAAVGFSFLFVAGTLVQIVGIMLSKSLAGRFGKKAVFITGASVTTVATALVFVAGPTQMSLMLWLNILWAIGWGPTVPLLWRMFADVAGHSEWLTHRRATGFMFSGCALAFKVGLGVGGALSTWLINAYGFVPNAAQTEDALLGIRLSASLYPALLLAAGIVCLIAYPIGKRLNLQIERALAERHREHAAVAGASAA